MSPFLSPDQLVSPFGKEIINGVEAELRRADLHTPNYFASGGPNANAAYFSGIHAAAGKIVNYFNPRDPVLNTAHRIQWAKSLPVPGDDEYHHVVEAGGDGSFFRDKNEQQRLTWQQNSYEIMAHILQGRTQVLGRVSVTLRAQNPQAVFDEQVNLDTGLAPPMGREFVDHSGQFRLHNMRRAAYWQQLLDTFFGP